ncbi:hypothetical protein l13_15050 [Neisseria weaveri ATCC 51223]|nr:hypothetical protein l13_15050 [Neisseria weaveri ATCC 51223]
MPISGRLFRRRLKPRLNHVKIPPDCKIFLFFRRPAARSRLKPLKHLTA